LEHVQATACEYDSSDWAGKPKLVAATCWNSLEAMLQSHKKALDVIRKVIHSTPEHDLSDETTSNHFMRRLNKQLKYLAALKSASVCMQTHLATLDDCQFQCDTIADLATVGLGKAGHDFEYCIVELLKFSVGNPYDLDDTFICAVIKVQQKREDELDTEKARVIEPWKLHYK
jgi:hypothetical protein